MATAKTASEPDLTEFIKLSKPKKPTCQIFVAKEQLKPADVKLLDAALAKDKGIITGAAIIEWLIRRDVTGPSPSTIVAHRGKRCSCYDNR